MNPLVLSIPLSKQAELINYNALQRVHDTLFTRDVNRDKTILLEEIDGYLKEVGGEDSYLKVLVYELLYYRELLQNGELPSNSNDEEILAAIHTLEDVLAKAHGLKTQKEFLPEQYWVEVTKRGDTLAYEVFFSPSSKTYRAGELRYDEPRWIFKDERPLLTWIKWENEFAPEAGTVYVPYTSTNPVEEAKKYLPRYTYQVKWSAKDQEYVGLCVEFPGLSWLDESWSGALKGIFNVVDEVLEDMRVNGELKVN